MDRAKTADFGKDKLLLTTDNDDSDNEVDEMKHRQQDTEKAVKFGSTSPNN